MRGRAVCTAVAWSTAALLAGSAGRSGLADADLDATATHATLDAVERVVSADPALTSALDPAGDGWRRDADGLVSLGWRSPRNRSVAARLGRRASDAVEIAGANGVDLRITLEGARPVEGALDRGRAAYRGVYPSTDLVWTSAEGRVEELLLLRSESAPTTFAWRVDAGTRARTEATGAVVLTGAGGAPAVRVRPPYAVDALGRRRDARLTYEEGRLLVDLDPTDLRFPVVLDPAMESVTWEPLMPPTSPAGRSRFGLDFDSTRGRTVLFGGDLSNVGLALADTWEWDGTTWTQKVVSAPPARHDFGQTFDSARSRTLIFGGYVAAANLGDTWTWDGTTWTEMSLTTSPSPRGFVPLAFDSARGVAVLFSGETGFLAAGECTSTQDTWEWDGTTWTQRMPATSPPARCVHSMVYDAARGRTVLFGGTNSAGVAFNDTWTWDGTTWTPMSPAQSPPARIGGAMAFDSIRGVVVLFGGSLTLDESSFADDTWEWDGTNWTETTAATPPPARGFNGLAFDAAHGLTVLFGGENGPTGTADLGDTWVYFGGNATCTANAQCETNHCIDGVCCAQVCGTCETCAGATPGQCSAVVNGDDPDSCTGTETCNATGVCTAKLGGACKSPSACASGFCTNGVCCVQAACPKDLVCGASGSCETKCTTNADCVAGTTCANGACVIGSACDGNDVVAPGSTPVACAPYTCADGKCSTSCQTAADCAVPNVCNASHDCVPPPSPGGTLAGCAIARGSRLPATAAFSLLGVLSLAAARRRRVRDAAVRALGAGVAAASLLPLLRCGGEPVAKVTATGGPGLEAARGGQHRLRLTPQGAAGAMESETWVQLQPAQSPAARTNHALVFDAARSQIVLFGGTDGLSDRGDTWTWDGTNWTLQAPASSPSPRQAPAMVYDSAHSVMLLFGGYFSGTGAWLNDTWTWDGTTWTQQMPAQPAAGRGWGKLAFDSARGKAVLFGGRMATGDNNDTWEWDGTTWTQALPSAPPTARESVAMSFDPVAGTTLLYGGVFAGNSTNLHDTWQWDGSQWTALSPSFAASPFDDVALTYILGGDTLLFAGNNDYGLTTTATALWSSGNWTLEAPTTIPPNRTWSALAYDAAEGYALLFGGGSGTSNENLGDTWVWRDHGGACTTGATCDTGLCVDGVCCDSTCGVCSACDTATPGTCAPVTNAEDPDSCTGTRTCSAGGTCGTKLGEPCTAGVDCASGFCVGDVCCGQAACPNDFACGAGGQCATSCSTQSDCQDGAACVAGRCATGATCSADGASVLPAPGSSLAPTPCGPYTCQGGRCLTSCSTAFECLPPDVCNDRSVCVPPPPGGTTAGGCLASSAGEPPGSGWGWFAAAGAWAALRRKRRA